MPMHLQNGASLFGPAHASFDAARGWIANVRDGVVSTFVPIHGKVAGYHVEKTAINVPVQAFNPPIKPESEVQIIKLNESGNIAIMPDTDSPGSSYYYPHINVDVGYEAAEEQPAS